MRVSFLRYLPFSISHSQILTTFHPSFLSDLLTILSRSLLRSIFSFQNPFFRLSLGFRHSCPCQKQPSTNTITLSLGNTKSGLPCKLQFLLQPFMWFFANNLVSAISVVSFPFDRIALIILERFSFERKSVTAFT